MFMHDYKVWKNKYSVGCTNIYNCCKKFPYSFPALYNFHLVFLFVLILGHRIAQHTALYYPTLKFFILCPHSVHNVSMLSDPHSDKKQTETEISILF